MLDIEPFSSDASRARTKLRVRAALDEAVAEPQKWARRWKRLAQYRGWPSKRRQDEAVAEAVAEERRALLDALEALVAARDALAAFGDEAGWLPEQGAYASAFTPAEYKVAQAVASCDEIILRLSTAALAAREAKP
jgi:hypothetical protein